MENTPSQGRVTRRYSRRDVNVRLGVFSSLKFKVEYATQMSEGGLLMNCEGTYEVGERIILTFRLPNSELMVIDGEVAYTFTTERHNHFAGIRFADASVDVLDHIRSYVELQNA